MRALSLKIPPALLLILFSLMMWLTAWLTPTIKWSFAWYGVLSWTLYIVAVLTILAGIISFRQAKTTVDPTRPERASTVVTTGVFNYSRNPMYLGFLLCLAAWAVRLSNPINLIFLPVFVWYLNRYQIEAEEQMLLQLFRQEYTDYCARVRRWI